MAEAAEQADRHQPAGVVTLLAPSQDPPPLAGDPPRLTLNFHDIDAPRDGLLAPGPEMVARLLTFAAGFSTNAVLLIHCWMGISRSPAAAYILACAFGPAGSETLIAQALRAASPSATPNPLFVRLADQHLGREGRMQTAIKTIGRGREASIGCAFELQI